jgi:hypothetical protein
MPLYGGESHLDPPEIFDSEPEEPEKPMPSAEEMLDWIEKHVNELEMWGTRGNVCLYSSAGAQITFQAATLRLAITAAMEAER